MSGMGPHRTHFLCRFCRRSYSSNEPFSSTRDKIRRPVHRSRRRRWNQRRYSDRRRKWCGTQETVDIRSVGFILYSETSIPEFYGRQPITTISISFTSSLLLVGTGTGLILVYDIPSHQLLRTISTHKGLAITYLGTMLKPPDLIGHVNLNLAVQSLAELKEIIPVKPVAPFQRMKDQKTREAHEVMMLLRPQSTVRVFILERVISLTRRFC